MSKGFSATIKKYLFIVVLMVHVFLFTVASGTDIHTKQAYLNIAEVSLITVWMFFSPTPAGPTVCYECMKADEA